MKRPYLPDELAAFDGPQPAVELRFETRDGMQSAYYLAPRGSNSEPPSAITCIFPGYRSTALDWLSFCRDYPYRDTGFLLLDYPGMGNCEGRYRPKNLVLTTRGALQALSRHIGQPDSLLSDVIFVGHSFGCGAALQSAPLMKVKRVILIAPFTTLRRAVFRRVGPLAWIMPDGLDNRKRLKDLHGKSPQPGVVLIHGEKDRSIPVRMGRSLASLYPDWIVYREIPGGGHVDILETQRPLIYDAIAGKNSMDMKRETAPGWDSQ